MPAKIQARLFHIDWILLGATIPLVLAGLITMFSFSGENTFFIKQITWVSLGVFLFFALSSIDVRPLKRTGVLVGLFLGAVAILVGVLMFGEEVRGSKSWISVGGFNVQPVDPVKLVIILILAKYFSRRHVEIAHIRHILVSAFYAFVPFALVLLQGDFGSALIIGIIWLGMVMVSGISKKHLLATFLIGVLGFALLWGYGFTENQKERVVSFLHPLADIQGAGYNAFQSTIAVGSGGLWGKGVGFGTQSRLEFLPEYETDFIFAAFAEEWGFAGVILLLTLFGIVLWRILLHALRGAGNFEMLFGMGLAIMLMGHITIHVGMNMGLLPVTGLPLPFVSYGGSHIVTEFIGLGLLMGFAAYEKPAHRDDMQKEFVGI